jgi:hypothetical protein
MAISTFGDLSKSECLAQVIPIGETAPSTRFATTYEEGVAAALAGAMPPGVPLLLLRTIAHNPRVLEVMRASSLLNRGSLDRRHREIVILRTTARCACAYEWRFRVLFFAARVALRKTEMAAIVYGGASDRVWSQPERALIRLVDELRAKVRSAQGDEGGYLARMLAMFRAIDAGSDPRQPSGARCPSCGWAPPVSNRWVCDCGHRWNTFDTRARCPACGTRHEWTACGQCGERSDHERWYPE